MAQRRKHQRGRIEIQMQKLYIVQMWLTSKSFHLFATNENRSLQYTQQQGD